MDCEKNGPNISQSAKADVRRISGLPGMILAGRIALRLNPPIASARMSNVQHVISMV